MTPAATLSISRTFHRGYELCTGNGLPAENGQSNAIIPGIVCLAFSIELAFKSILLAVSKPTSGHKLDQLFQRLPAAEQHEVILESGVDTQSFHENLALVANAFVEWRYIYERPGAHSISEQFLQMLSHAADAVAARKVNSSRRKGAKTSPTGS